VRTIGPPNFETHPPKLFLELFCFLPKEKWTCWSHSIFYLLIVELRKTFYLVWDLISATLKSSRNLESFKYRCPSTSMRFSITLTVVGLSFGPSGSIPSELSSGLVLRLDNERIWIMCKKVTQWKTQTPRIRGPTNIDYLILPFWQNFIVVMN